MNSRMYFCAQAMFRHSHGALHSETIIKKNLSQYFVLCREKFWRFNAKVVHLRCLSALKIFHLPTVQSQKTQGFCVADFATLSDERRSRSKIFCYLILIKEPCARKCGGLARSKLLGISKTMLLCLVRYITCK